MPCFQNLRDWEPLFLVQLFSSSTRMGWSASWSTAPCESSSVLSKQDAPSWDIVLPWDTQSFEADNTRKGFPRCITLFWQVGFLSSFLPHSCHRDAACVEYACATACAKVEEGSTVTSSGDCNDDAHDNGTTSKWTHLSISSHGEDCVREKKQPEDGNPDNSSSGAEERFVAGGEANGQVSLQADKAHVTKNRW